MHRYFICEGCNRPIKVDADAAAPTVCPFCEYTEIRPTRVIYEPETIVEEGEAIDLYGFWCSDCGDPFYVLVERKDECMCPYCGSLDFEPID